MSKKPTDKNKVILMEHTYDGIQEYDQKLPNWWLFTLYAAIVISVVYWFLYGHAGGESAEQRINRRMNEVQALRLEQSIDITNNDLFWQMRDNPDMVLQGQDIFMTNCKACHGANLEGGVGENLVDREWKHGHLPFNIYNTINNGVPDKGMQAWGNTLGQKKIVQVIAFILSKQGDRQSMESEAVKKE